jgi:hypothetical protein
MVISEVAKEVKGGSFRITEESEFFSEKKNPNLVDPHRSSY